MPVTEIAFTGYPADDLPKSRAFYENVLGLKVSRTFGPSENPQFIEYDIGTGCLAVVGSGGKWPSANAGPAVALEVDDFDLCIRKLKAAGAPFVDGPNDFPTCRMAIVQDPSGNRVGIHYRKAS